MAKVTLDDYLAILQDRPRKFDAEQVNYVAAPEGSAMRCASCIHHFRRSIDNFMTCEIFRSDESDRIGVQPHWRCDFWNVELGVYPLLEKQEEENEEDQESLSEA